MNPSRAIGDESLLPLFPHGRMRGIQPIDVHSPLDAGMLWNGASLSSLTLWASGLAQFNKAHHPSSLPREEVEAWRGKARSALNALSRYKDSRFVGSYSQGLTPPGTWAELESCLRSAIIARQASAETYLRRSLACVPSRRERITQLLGDMGAEGSRLSGRAKRVLGRERAELVSEELVCLLYDCIHTGLLCLESRLLTP